MDLSAVHKKEKEFVVQTVFAFDKTSKIDKTIEETDIPRCNKLLQPFKTEDKSDCNSKTSCSLFQGEVESSAIYRCL